MTTMRNALKGISMIAIAASTLFTACGNPGEDTANGVDSTNTAAPASAPVDTNTSNAGVDTLKAAPADSVKK